MGKKETAKKLFGMALKRPKTAIRAFGYAGKYGLVGLRDRLHEEIVAEDVLEPLDYADPGSVKGNIVFSVLLPVYNVKVDLLKEAINSVFEQSYANWELCIVDDCSTETASRSYLNSLSDKRVKVLFSDKNQGISEATNKAASLAHGDYLVLLDNDDLLMPNALEELFIRLSMTQADIIYTDNDVIDEDNNRLAVLMKPDWSPDLFYSQMYIGHLLAFKRTLFDEVRGFNSEFDGSQDYDLVLRMSEKTSSIEHIQKVLYSWRSIPSSTSGNPDAKPYAQTAGLNALQAHFDRVSPGEVIVNETENLFVYDVRYKIADPTTITASIIIPTKDHVDDLKAAIDSIFNKTVTSYRYEVLILDNGSTELKTKEYLQNVSNEHKNVRVLNAPYAFNWSKLNNQGINESNSDVIVCLNNDVEVISKDWLDRLIENALRKDVGVVGGLLLYPDGTIQHAGVVIGLGGWADHVYKGTKPVHYGNPFISPVVNRNVSAVTGACMAFSRNLIESIGIFDENFVICGSDVELCLRARKYGFNNLYLPKVCLTHYESKTRDPKDIPETDFQLSEEAYRNYLLTGDPYYNSNLDYDCCIPTLVSRRKQQHDLSSQRAYVVIPEIRPLYFRKSSIDRKRINLLIPSINIEDIYGGISTALKFYKQIVQKLQCDARILVLDGEPRADSIKLNFDGYYLASMEDDLPEKLQIVSVANRNRRNSIPVSKGDIFLCTSWWSAYCIQAEYKRNNRNGLSFTNPLIYLIQDYEPGFYSWSTNYLLAESTYASDVPKIAVFNSNELQEHIRSYHYPFLREYCFNPFLNQQLKERLLQYNGRVAKRRKILVYGRPHTDRNAFGLVVESLRQWIEMQEDSKYWDFVSAGEAHAPVPLGKGRYLASVGKLPLDRYADLLSESYAGISLMVSPHPSYPPLEMASFGVKTITNTYMNKDLSSFSKNIFSLRLATPWEIACCLDDICKEYQSEVPCGNVLEEYINGGEAFPFMNSLLGDIRSIWKESH